MNIHTVMSKLLDGEVVESEFIHAGKVYRYRAMENPFVAAFNAGMKKIPLYMITISEVTK